MKRKIAFLEILIIVLSVILPSFDGALASEYINNFEKKNSETHIYTTDLFYGYSKILTNKAFIGQYETDMLGTVAAVQEEYICTPEFGLSIGITSLKDLVSTSELIKYFSDRAGITEFEHSKHLDATNAKFMQELCNEEYIAFDDVDTVTTFLTASKKIVDFNRDMEKFALDCESFKKDKKAAETYNDFIDWSFGYLKDYCTHIDSKDFDTLKTKWFTYFNTVSDNLGYTLDAMEFTKGLITSIIMYDLQMEIAKDILENQNTNTLLYKGMERYKKQLEIGFVAKYSIEYLSDEFIGEMASIYDELVYQCLNVGQIYTVKIAKIAICLSCEFIMWSGDLTDPDDFLVSVILAEYARDMYDYLDSKTTVYDGCFISDEIIEFEKAFDYCMAASKLALEEAKKIAEYNAEYDVNFVDETLSLYEKEMYTAYIDSLKKYLQDGNKEYFEAEVVGNEVYIIKDNCYEIAMPSDNVEKNKIYTFNNKVFANMKLNNSTLTIPEGVTIEIDGYLYIDENSKVVNNGNLIVNGKLTVYGGEFENNGSILVNGEVYSKEGPITNNGKMIIKNYLEVYGANVTNNSSIHIKGDFSFQGTSFIFSSQDFYMYNNSATLDVDGNVVLYGNGYIECVKNSSMKVKGDITFQPGWGLTASRSCAITMDNSKLYCEGKIEELLQEYSTGRVFLENGAELYVKGDILFGKYSSYEFSKGKIVLEGTETQKIQGMCINDVEVTNPAGITLNTDIKVRGYLNMNGYPVNGENKTLILYEGAKLSEGTAYPNVDIKGLNELDFNLECDVLKITIADIDFIIKEDVKLDVNKSFYLGADYGYGIVKITNYGCVDVSENMNLEYKSIYHNYGETNIGRDLLINSNDGYSLWGSLGTYYYNYNHTGVVGMIKLNYLGKMQMVGEESILYVGGDILNSQNIHRCDLKSGKVILNGVVQQNINNVGSFSVLEIENYSEEGIVFSNVINVSKLFNHNRNHFVLYNDGKESSFVDYDCDGMLDNVDEYPLVKYEKLEAPASNLEEGTYAEEKEIILNVNDTEATIYYTLDGSDPSIENGQRYEESIKLSGMVGQKQNIVIKAVSIKAGAKTSDVATYEYVIDIPKPQVVNVEQLLSIKDIANGVEKTVEALGLPRTIIAYLDDGSEIIVNVEWILEECIYDPNETKEQVVTIIGNLFFGEDYEVPNDLLQTEINVTILAAEEIEPNDEPVENVGYEIVELINASWISGTDNDIIAISNAKYDKLSTILVDGKVVSNDFYKVVDGSTKVVLRAEYIEKLSEGNHTLSIVYNDGQANAEFEVIKCNDIVVNNPYTGEVGNHWILWLIMSGIFFLCVNINFRYRLDLKRN